MTLYALNPISAEIASINFSGNIIPHTWYTTIRYQPPAKKDGKLPPPKTNALALLCLGEIVYWYRPIELAAKDSPEGRVLYSKIKDDLLRKSATDFADKFGAGRHQIRTALDLLEDLGAITRHLRTKQIGRNLIPNVPYIELHPGVLFQLTHPDKQAVAADGQRSAADGQRAVAADGQRLAADGHLHRLHIENTVTENTTENTQQQQQQDGTPDQIADAPAAETQLLLSGSEDQGDSLSHSSEKPKNKGRAGLAPLGQDNAIAGSPSADQPPRASLNGSAGASHSNRQPTEVTAAGLASLDPNSPSNDFMSSSTQGEQNGELASPLEYAALPLLCETMGVDFGEMKGVIEVFHEYAGLWPTTNQCRLLGEWLRDHGRPLLLDAVGELRTRILAAPPEKPVAAPFAYLIKIVDGLSEAKAAAATKNGDGGYTIPDEYAGVIIG